MLPAGSATAEPGVASISVDSLLPAVESLKFVVTLQRENKDPPSRSR